MELSQDIIIELALSLTSYLAVSALSILLYSMISRRRRSESKEHELISADTHEEPMTFKRDIAASTRLEFVRFGETAPAQSDDATETAEEPAFKQEDGQRRNRAEIARVAAAMLKAGASKEKIKQVLPISEAELSMISLVGSN